jgi:uncharacterized protein (TIGR03000 family)
MNRPSWKTLVFGLVMMVAVFAFVGQANAWCHGCGGGYYVGYSAYSDWSGCCGGDWYWGYAYRSSRHCGLGRGCWGGWYGAYAGCCPRYSCGYTSYSCCGGSVVSSCCGDTSYGAMSGTVQGTTTAPSQPTPAKKPVIEAPAPTAEPGATPAPAAPAPGIEPSPATPAVPAIPAPTTNVTPENSGILTVFVPYDAKVTINGMATKSTGSRRQFVSYDLKEGFSYKYEVKAEVVRDGKIVEDTKSVVLTAGAGNSVAFGFNIAPTEVAANSN